MSFNLDRSTVQIISSLFFVTGIVGYFTSGFQVGGTLMGIGFYIIIMSESSLLSRVQSEMTFALEKLNKRRENEIQDLLYFLKRSQLASSPFESIDRAKILCDKISYPAMVLTPGYQIIKANGYMHNLLGWDRNELNGKGAHLINDPTLMSKIGEISKLPENRDKQSVITQYIYISKSGKKIVGQMDCSFIKNEGFFVVFHPAVDCLISHDEIKLYVNT